MALVRLTAGADVTRCPECGSLMRPAFRGRVTQLWFRQCTNQPRCSVSTVTDETPAEYIPRPMPEFPRPRTLPLERES